MVITSILLTGTAIKLLVQLHFRYWYFDLSILIPSPL